MGCTPEGYIRQNAPIVAENCIKDLLWHDDSFSKTLAKEEDYLIEYQYCNPHEFTNTVRNILREISQNEETLKKFIRQRRALIVRPYYRTYGAYLKGEWETELTLPQVLNLVRAEL